MGWQACLQFPDLPFQFDDALLLFCRGHDEGLEEGPVGQGARCSGGIVSPLPGSLLQRGTAGEAAPCVFLDSLGDPTYGPYTCARVTVGLRMAPEGQAGTHSKQARHRCRSIYGGSSGSMVRIALVRHTERATHRPQARHRSPSIWGALLAPGVRLTANPFQAPIVRPSLLARLARLARLERI